MKPIKRKHHKRYNSAPYGAYFEPDGGIVLHNRRYQPMYRWHRKQGTVPVPHTEQIRYVRQGWFYTVLRAYDPTKDERYQAALDILPVWCDAVYETQRAVQLSGARAKSSIFAGTGYAVKPDPLPTHVRRKPWLPEFTSMSEGGTIRPTGFVSTAASQ